ncbi:MAG: hypothetical protein KDK99_05480 [Verrucomicrobiales bacterium]|nr:hypothetical protein [Verrucomicrobiales bacterium]
MRLLHFCLPALLLATGGPCVFAADETPAGSAAESPDPATLPNEPGRDWTLPPADGSPWLQQATGMRFPLHLLSYTLIGIMKYPDSEDVLVRYESLSQRARADIFIFKLANSPKDAASKKEALQEGLSQVFTQLAQMHREGIYEDVKEDRSLSGSIPLWKEDAIPLIVREMSATRVDKAPNGVTVKSPLKLWLGLTVMADHLITIRHLRPSSTGKEGEDDMKRFFDHLMEIIKDPSLRAEIVPAINTYLQDPFSEAGHESANLIVEYLDESPTVSILRPAAPVTTWTEEAEKTVQGSGSQLLRAYVIGGASAALQGKDANTALTTAAQQMVRVYLKMKEKYPAFSHPGLDQLTDAVERGDASTWLRKQIEEKAPQKP